jgi:hypothetical protein
MRLQAIIVAFVLGPIGSGLGNVLRDYYGVFVSAFAMTISREAHDISETAYWV